jgi:hypothetical protein
MAYRAAFGPPDLGTPGVQNSATGYYRNRLFVAISSGTPRIDIYDTTIVAGGQFNSPQQLNSYTLTVGNNINSVTAVGNYMLYTGNVSFTPGTPPGATSALVVVQLGPNRDGNGATTVGAYYSNQPLSNPLVAGDLLYIQQGTGIAVLDLTPLWNTENAAAANVLMPTYIVSQGVGSGSNNTPGNSSFLIDGPWAMSMTSDVRIYDLR